MSRTTISTAMLPMVVCLLWGADPAVAQQPAKTAIAAVPYVAQTVTGAKVLGPFSAGGIMWQCADNRCTASGAEVLPEVSACAELARMVGRIQSYAYGAKSLIDIQKCNATADLASADALGKLSAGTPSSTARGPIRTVMLQFQGSGASLAQLYPAFAPMRVTTVALQFRGSGASLAELYPAFAPVTVRTVQLQLRAAGTLP